MAVAVLTPLHTEPLPPVEHRRFGRDGPIVVVGYDGSPESRRAVEVAVERAGPGGTVIPLHVTPTVSPWLGRQYYMPAVDASHAAAEAVLDTLGDIDPGLASIEADLIEGDPAEALLDVARSRGAREIVVGSRGRGRLSGALLGSVSQAVVARADRPVVIVPRAALDDA